MRTIIVGLFLLFLTTTSAAGLRQIDELTGGLDDPTADAYSGDDDMQYDASSLDDDQSYVDSTDDEAYQTTAGSSHLFDPPGIDDTSIPSVKDLVNAHLQASSPQSTALTAQNLMKYVPAKNRPKWLSTWHKTKVWPYAWAIYDTKLDKTLIHYGNQYLFFSQAHYLGMRCLAAYKNSWIYTFYRSKVVFVKKYNKNRFHCFMSQDAEHKSHFMTACLDIVYHRLHIAHFYDYYKRSYTVLGEATCSRMTR
jgi:hypothetical protein